MKFHDFVTAKQRALKDFETQLNSGHPSDLWGISDAQYRQGLLASIADMRRKSNNEFLSAIAAQKDIRRIGPGKWTNKIIGDIARTQISTLIEYEWYNTERPYYNVYPIVEQLIRNTKLNVSSALLSFPYRTMLFRFSAGHEPHGIKSVLITIGHPHVVAQNTCYETNYTANIFSGVAASALVEYVKPIPNEPGVHHETYVLPIDLTEVTSDTNFYEPRFTVGDQVSYDELAKVTQVLQSPLPFKIQHLPPEAVVCLRPIEETISAQHATVPAYPAALTFYMGYQSFEVHQFVFKLAAFVSLLHRGSDLITPIVLAKHQERYAVETNEAAKKWLEDKAAQMQGRGFSVGKQLNEQSLVSPHWRNPHMALYWTGPGRKEPKLVLRAGAVVVPKHLSNVPTGFLGEEISDEHPTETAAEHVYFLQEPSVNYIKIGRTRRTVADRQRESQTFVPGGLRLIGYIPTGDSVTLETRLHREYAHKRRDNEFFELSVAEARSIIENFGGIFCPSDN